MDIDLLSRMVHELIVDHDQVGLPGVGTFVAEMVPASFSDKGYTINPPYRRLSFYPSRLEDSLLIDFYASSNQLDQETARTYITQYLAELKTVLEERKSIILPGLGRLRATKENTLFFVADEGLDIFPAGVGLRPVSLKSHILEEEPVVIDVPPPVSGREVEPILQPTIEVEEPEVEEVEPEPVEEIPEATPFYEEPVAEEAGDSPVEPANDEENVPANDDEAEPEPVEEPVEPVAEEPETEEVEPEQEEEIPDQVRDDEEVVSHDEEMDEIPEVMPLYEEPVAEEAEPVRKKAKWWLVLLLVLLTVSVIALATFIILAQVAPDFIDSLLYTPEELRIINY